MAGASNYWNFFGSARTWRRPLRAAGGRSSNSAGRTILHLAGQAALMVGASTNPQDHARSMHGRFLPGRRFAAIRAACRPSRSSRDVHDLGVCLQALQQTPLGPSPPDLAAAGFVRPRERDGWRRIPASLLIGRRLSGCRGQHRRSWPDVCSARAGFVRIADHRGIAAPARDGERRRRRRGRRCSHWRRPSPAPASVSVWFLPPSPSTINSISAVQPRLLTWSSGAPAAISVAHDLGMAEMRGRDQRGAVIAAGDVRADCRRPRARSSASARSFATAAMVMMS